MNRSLYSGRSVASGSVVSATDVPAAGTSGVGTDGVAHHDRATITPHTREPTIPIG